MTKQDLVTDYETRKKKQFFALGRELGYNSEQLKQRAKDFWGEKETFNNLSITQILILIEKLQTKKYERR